MDNIEKKIGIAMRISVTIALVFIVFGIILLVFTGSLGIDVGVINYAEVFIGLSTFSSGSYLILGIMFLLITPIVRVVASIFSFVKIKDKKYVFITVLVLAILFVSFIFGTTR